MKKTYTVIYTITKQELLADSFDTNSESKIKKELEKLAKKYNKQDEATQITSIEILSIEEE